MSKTEDAPIVLQPAGPMFAQALADDPLEWHRSGTVSRVCTGPCDQGRRPCPCREACEIPVDYNLRRTVWLVYAVLLLAILGAIFWPY